MATLVLTTVGRVVAGPVGAAIGALVGQRVDQVVLGTRKQGPRLTELAVQTSSYGTQLPKLFGTIRVAGTVIWATDLIETRGSSGGKGGSGTTTYSYSASFAVLLSARPIVAVRRIWAEGKLLRGAGGDWKTKTGFRLHLGGEDQAVDPLIGSAEGALATAHRGCAYAVFEGLQLADFGNRIPSLTFEVVADAAPVGAAAIAAALAPEVEGEVALVLDGFAATGGSVGAVLETLATASGAWWAERGDRLAMRDRAVAMVTLGDDGVAASGSGVRGSRTIAALETVARTVTVTHYDAARDYQAGMQRTRRGGAGEREERIEVPAVLSAATAKAIAEGAVLRGEAMRTRRTIATGLAAMAVAPGDCVTIAGEAGTWRVVRATIEAMVTKLELAPVTVASAAAGSATSGRVLAAADDMVGATVVHAFETATLDDTLATAPRLTVAACGVGAGWRQAALLYSLDDGASWVAAGATAAPATIGRLVEVAAVEVQLTRADMVLGDADAGAIERGDNLMLVGDELVQFARATPLGAERWRLGELTRGVRGTEAATGTQRIGDRVVLLAAAALRTIDLPASALGRQVRVLASGVGDGEPVAATTVMAGASVLPPAPTALAAEATADGGLAVRWVRRSRIGWRWRGKVAAPLGEEREAYVVTVTGATSERAYDTVVPSLTIPRAERPAGALTIAVRQRGTWGTSPAATLRLAG